MPALADAAGYVFFAVFATTSDGVRKLTATSIVTDRVMAGRTASRPASASGMRACTNSDSFQASVTIAPEQIEAMAPSLVARFQTRAATSVGVMQDP